MQIHKVRIGIQETKGSSGCEEWRVNVNWYSVSVRGVGKALLMDGHDGSTTL